jgi:hypothetical protein
VPFRSQPEFLTQSVHAHNGARILAVLGNGERSQWRRRIQPGNGQPTNGSRDKGPSCRDPHRRKSWRRLKRQSSARAARMRSCNERRRGLRALRQWQSNSITMKMIRSPATFRAFALVSSESRRRQRKIPRPGCHRTSGIRSHNVVIHNLPKRQVYWSKVLAHIKHFLPRKQ